MRLWPWIVAVPAAALCSGLVLHLTGTWEPWAKLDGLTLTAPAPMEVALRKNLSELASRTNLGPAHAEDLAAATAFYNARSRPLLLWVTESGISERGNSIINEIRKADDWGCAPAISPCLNCPTEPSPRGDGRGRDCGTFVVLKYAGARGGRFGDLSSISKLPDYKPPAPTQGRQRTSPPRLPRRLLAIPSSAIRAVPGVAPAAFEAARVGCDCKRRAGE